MTEIETSDDEVLVRSLHPSLERCDCVSVVELGQIKTSKWLVSARSARHMKYTHAAGREIHVLPMRKQDAKGNSGFVARQVARCGSPGMVLAVAYQYVTNTYPLFFKFICYKAHWVVICKIQQLTSYGW